MNTMKKRTALALAISAVVCGHNTAQAQVMLEEAIVTAEFEETELKGYVSGPITDSLRGRLVLPALTPMTSTSKRKMC